MTTKKKTAVKRGAPSKYKPEYAKQAYRLALLNLTDVKIAEFFEVSVSTLNYWKVNHPNFSEALRRGKTSADGAVVEGLYKRATGCSVKETYKSRSGNITKTVIRELPPDVGACTLWLKNRHPEVWRDKQNIEIDYDRLSDEQLDAIIARIQGAGKNG